ncbi:MAG: hypothetical protein CH6_1093 [Candidatus Kapaibacterium sp.]|nr:MAG: hypothetical protein CH6_1093 [Candidatus Kapabacteria bacterium]
MKFFDTQKKVLRILRLEPTYKELKSALFSDIFGTKTGIRAYL